MDRWEWLNQLFAQGGHGRTAEEIFGVGSGVPTQAGWTPPDGSPYGRGDAPGYGTSTDPETAGFNLFGDARAWLAQNSQIFNPYTGPMTAGLSPLQQQARTNLTASISNNLYRQPTVDAIGIARGVGGYSPQTVGGPGATAQLSSYGGDVSAMPIAPTTASYAGNVNPISVTANYTGGPAAISAQSVSPTTSFGAVQPGSFASGNWGAYMNPFTDNVVNTALSDIDRARQMAVNSGARSASASTYGGSRNALVEAETNRAFLDQSARTAAQLRSQGFDTAAGLMGQDLSRGLSAGLANQQAAISGAGLGLQGQLANQGAGLQASLANQAASQRSGEFGAGLGMQAALANQSAGLQAGLANQSTLQGVNQFNANLGLQGGLANQDAMLRAALSNQGMRQGANQFNAGVQNDANQFNANLRFQEQLANQQAGLAGAGMRLQGAGMMGDLASNLQGFGMDTLAMQNQFGTQDQATNQAGLGAAYQEYLRSMYGPMEGYNFLGGLLSGNSYPTPGGPSNAQGFLGGAATGAGIGGAFGPWGAGIGAGLGGLIGLFG